MFQVLNIDFGELLFRIKLISFVLSLIFASIVIYFIVIFQKLVGVKIQREKTALRGKEEVSGGAVSSKWEEIMRHFSSEKEAEWKFAIIEADKLADDLLKAAGYPGDTMGERLMNIEKGQLVSLEGLWEAHKVRNKLVHDANYFLRYAEARKVMELFKSVLEELNAI